MIYNILCCINTEYAKLSFLNINSYHRLDKDKKFAIFCDDIIYEWFQAKTNNFNYPDNVEIIKLKEKREAWQLYKIDIFKHYYQKEDFVIIDADSNWSKAVDITKNAVTFLNKSYVIGTRISKDIVADYTHLDDIIGIKPSMTNNQIGFLSIPKQFHKNNILDEWYSLANKIKNLKNVRKGLNFQSEQLSISLIIQINGYPIKFLKDKEGLNNRNILHSFYWSHINEEQKNSHLKGYNF